MLTLGFLLVGSLVFNVLPKIFHLYDGSLFDKNLFSAFFFRFSKTLASRAFHGNIQREWRREKTNAYLIHRQYSGRTSSDLSDGYKAHVHVWRHPTLLQPLFRQSHQWWWFVLFAFFCLQHYVQLKLFIFFDTNVTIFRTLLPILISQEYWCNAV